MIKHIGKHGDRKVAIVFREVPGEEHMALVVYPETLPISFHDAIMKVIESPVGQTADNLGDALFRSLLSDGRPMLQTLHVEGMIKKVQAKQVTVTPGGNSSVNLDEMNGIIRKMKMGEDAIREMAELDANKGYTGKARRRDDYGREVGAPAPQRMAEVAGSDAAKALDDAQLAQDRLAQAHRMEAEARGLLAESQRLKAEAEAMAGGAPKPKRGRKPKVVAANAA
jgi:hypothetical protein